MQKQQGHPHLRHLELGCPVGNKRENMKVLYNVYPNLIFLKGMEDFPHKRVVFKKLTKYVPAPTSKRIPTTERALSSEAGISLGEAYVVFICTKCISTGDLN